MEHGSGTHVVFNQTPPLMDYNLFESDAALQEAVQREGKYLPLTAQVVREQLMKLE